MRDPALARQVGLDAHSRVAGDQYGRRDGAVRYRNCVGETADAVRSRGSAPGWTARQWRPERHPDRSRPIPIDYD